VVRDDGAHLPTDFPEVKPNMAIPKIVVGDIAQVIINSKVNGQTCLNVLHYKCELMDPALTYAEAMDQLMTKVGGPSPSVVSYMSLAMASNCQVESIRAQRVSPLRDIYIAQAIGLPGVLAVPANLPNVAGVITKQTEKAGRGRQGSFHLAGMPPADFVDGSLTVPAVNRLQTIADQLQANVLVGATVKWVPGTISPQAALAERFHPLFECFPQTTARVMRRRTVGLGI